MPGCTLCGGGPRGCLIDGRATSSRARSHHENFLEGKRPRPGGLSHGCGEDTSCSRTARPQTGAPDRVAALRLGLPRRVAEAKFFTGLRWTATAPECVKGHGERCVAESEGLRAQNVRQSVAPFQAGDGHHRPLPGCPDQSGTDRIGLRREPLDGFRSLTAGSGTGTGVDE